MDIEEVLKRAEGFDQATDAGTLSSVLQRLLRKNAQVRAEASEPVSDNERTRKLVAQSDEEVAKHLETMMSLAAEPESYPGFVKCGGVVNCINALVHESTRVAASATRLIDELVDTDTPRECAPLLTELLRMQAPALLLRNLRRFDECQATEGLAVYWSMSVLESLCELDLRSLMRQLLPQEAPGTEGRGDLFLWLLLRITATLDDTADVDADTRSQWRLNTHYAAELLSIFVAFAAAHVASDKQYDALRELPHFLTNAGAVKTIVKLLERDILKSKSGQHDDEQKEFYANLMDTLSGILLSDKHQMERTAQDVLCNSKKGYKTLNKLLRWTSFTRAGVLKVLDCALTDNSKACVAWVDSKGFKVLFPVLLALAKKQRFSVEEVECQRHLVSLVQHLFENLTGVYFARLLHKFAEKDCEKTRALVRLHAHVHTRLDQIKAQGPEALREQPTLLEQLESGLVLRQQIDMCLAFLLTSGSTALTVGVVSTLRSENSSVARVAASLSQYLAETESDETQEEESKTNATRGTLNRRRIAQNLLTMLQTAATVVVETSEQVNGNEPQATTVPEK